MLIRYPSADKLRLNQYFLYTACLVIMNDPRMSAEQKLKSLIEVRLINLSAKRRTLRLAST